MLIHGACVNIPPTGIYTEGMYGELLGISHDQTRENVRMRTGAHNRIQL
jgi:hypothetical protein